MRHFFYFLMQLLFVLNLIEFTSMLVGEGRWEGKMQHMLEDSENGRLFIRKGIFGGRKNHDLKEMFKYSVV